MSVSKRNPSRSSSHRGNPRSEEKEVLYCSPGMNDTYLRPEPGQKYAPRQVAICVKNKDVWMSWIHYHKGKDYLVATRKTPHNQGRMSTLSSVNQKHFSKPVFLSSASFLPEIFCAIVENKRMPIYHYIMDKGGWKCKERIFTSCHTIYCLDTVVDAGGNVLLAYAGMCDELNTLQVYTRKFCRQRWEEEQIHLFDKASVNRPRIAVGGDGSVVVVADVYHNSKYDVFSKIINEKSRQSWQRVSTIEGWNLFPSIVCDAKGTLWVSWLREYPVEREEVIGLYQEAWIARIDCKKRDKTDTKTREMVVHLNWGLLPVKRYFGCAGLRRYPRLMATDDSAIWLLWEQQKDEKEIWANVDNDLFCGKRYCNDVWSRSWVLTDKGVCHTFDEKTLHRPDSFIFAVKGKHMTSGNDFRVINIELTRISPYREKSIRLWKDWIPQRLPRHHKPVSISLPQEEYRLLWGDLHCHSFFSSDAEGEPDELYFFARDLACLDFVCIIDNDFFPHKALLNSEIRYTANLAKSISQRREFVALSGYEWTFHRPDRERSFNHRMVIFAGKKRFIVRRNEEEGMTEESFADHIKNYDCLVFPHHARWNLLSLKNECNVEVTSGWGPYILDADTIHKALGANSRFGFLGNSDGHRFMPGLSGALTGLYSKELSKEAIVDALKKRRCFATTGNRTEVGFWINDSFMGEETTTEDFPKIRWKVKPVGEIERIETIRNGKTVYRSQLESGEYMDKHIQRGINWYYLRVKEKGEYKRYPHNVASAFGKWAWSSPIWVKS